MPDALRLALALTLAFGGAVLVTPLAIRLAWRTSFLDKPVSYKRHARPTPCLGGVAVMAVFVPAALLFGGTGSAVVWILAGAVVMLVVGTIDDRVSLGPLPRLAVEAGVAVVLWADGLGWSAFNSDVASLALTIFWVVGLVNAFNLMDNLDGAAGTVGAVCAAGVAAAVFSLHSVALAAVAIALSGACAGFLLNNLKRPARIFLGDGGSMPIGFLVAAVLMAVSRNDNGLGAAAVVAAAPLAGLAILDTTLVMVSRTRRGVPLLSGGRDHLTHRLLGRLGTPQRVALTLAVLQAALCGLGVWLLHSGSMTVVAAGIVYIALGSAAILFLDRSQRFRPDWLPAAERASKPPLTTPTPGQESAY